jgi:hypothetical protein
MGDKRPNNNDGRGNTYKRKWKYDCNLYMEDHPTHLFPRLAEAQKLLRIVAAYCINKPISTWEKYHSSLFERGWGKSGTPMYSSNPSVLNIYMMKGDNYIETRAQDYGMSKTVEKGKEVVNPYVPLQIERTMGKKMTCILKGVFKKYSHNPNVRASQNHFVVEDLSQTPCAMSSLEVL